MSLVQGLENGSIRPGWSKAKRRHRRRHAAALGTTLVSPLPTQTEPRSRISRRAFLATSATAGGALVLGLTLHRSFRLKPNGEDPFDTWIRIHPDGQIQLVVNKSEMGQGVYTALPMILAEEAEIDWQQITVLQSENSVGTGGSSSVHKSYQPLRQAGAVVRETMIAAAARRWEVPSADCFAQKSHIFHRPTGRSLSYGALVKQARRLPLPDASSVRLKDRKDFTLLGRSIPHLDIPDKVKGKTCYGIDVRLPGMVYAVVAQCPFLSGRLIRFDAAKAKAVPGVLDVFEIPIDQKQPDKTGGEVAVVAKSTWAAIQGRKALNIEWKQGDWHDESTESLTAKLRTGLDAQEYWNWSNTNLNPDGVPAAKRIESVYEFPFLAHATLEPMNCTVRIENGKCEVWSPTQTGDGAQKEIAKLLGLPESEVTVHVTFMGGGFGRRFGGAFDRQAVRVAQRIKLPVQLVWTREDDFTHDAYRPACMHRLRAGMDEHANLVSWTDRIANTSIIGQEDPKQAQAYELGGAVDVPYPAPHIRVSYAPVESGVPRGAWRGVEITFNVLAVECFIDELAYLAKEDPYLFRRRLFETNARLTAGKTQVHRPGVNWPQPDPIRTIAMLDLVTEKAGWGKPLGRNRGRGIACYRSVETYLAQVAEVTVDAGNLRVDRIVTVVDPGQVINMNGIRAQIEGGVLFGLSAVLKERITVKDGSIQQQNFNAYDLLRISDAPELETYVVESDRDAGGIGEPPVALVGPSVGNAIFAATGKRLKKLPFQLD
jgi:isoquinoline 1-oxidoreductase beta subunit